MEKKEFVQLQFDRFDSKEAFVEVTQYFDKNKIKLSFCKYDEQQGNKMTCEISYFFSCSEALIFAENICSGKIRKVLKKAPDIAKEKGIKREYVELYKTDVTGNFKKDRYRQVKILPGVNSDYLLSASSGPGAEGDNGLIKIVAKPDSFIGIPMSEKKMQMLASSLKRAVNICDMHMYSRWQTDELLMRLEKADVTEEQIVKAVLQSSPFVRDLMKRRVEENADKQNS